MTSARIEHTPWLQRYWPILPVGVLIGLCAWSYLETGFIYQVLRSDLPAQEKIETTRQFILGFRAIGWLIYLVMVITEVLIAPIPGAILYAPGGMIFGGFWGGVLTLLGNTVGAGFACLITRKFAGDRIEAWQERDRFRSLSDQISKKGFWIVLALRLNPLTSSDVVSYAAGVTRIPIRKVMAGTFIGMAPLCFLQSYFAYQLIANHPNLLYPTLVLCALYGIVAVWLFLRASSTQSPNSGNRHPDG